MVGKQFVSIEIGASFLSYKQPPTQPPLAEKREELCLESWVPFSEETLLGCAPLPPILNIQEEGKFPHASEDQRWVFLCKRVPIAIS